MHLSQHTIWLNVARLFTDKALASLFTTMEASWTIPPPTGREDPRGEGIILDVENSLPIRTLLLPFRLRHREERDLER